MSKTTLHVNGARKRVEVQTAGKATLRYLRAPAQKTRIVANAIRGRRVDEAFAFLRHSPKSVSNDLLKLLRSAVANTENSADASMFDPDELWVTRAEVDEGPHVKRIQPAPMGRAFPILKRQCHVHLEVGSPMKAAGAADARKG